MSGCRGLTDEEVNKVLDSFSGIYQERDKALFVLGLRTGFRVSELLSLRIKDVLENNQVINQVTVQRRFMKQKYQSRSVVLHQQAKDALSNWVSKLRLEGELQPDTYLFKSRNGQNKPLTRVQVHRILKTIFKNKLSLTGKLASHTWRKTFAQKIFLRLNNDLFKTKEALGHRDINNTIRYLNYKQEEVDAAILTS